MRIPGPVDLAATLQGGQAFRWRLDDEGAFVGTIGRRLVRFRAGRGGALDARATPRTSRAVLERYLGATAQDDARRDRVGSDERLSAAVAAHPGLRILRQDPWETTVAFITSANNNVLRIEGILERLALRYGEPVSDGETMRASFPAPEKLARASEAALRAAGLGYRAPFLRQSARLVAKGDLDLESWRGSAPHEARAALLSLPGVGPKVADCIALFGLDVTGAFPLDRWVLRAVVDTFPDAFPAGRETKPRAIEAFARERWGDDAGLAQQYLFHLVRVKQGAPGTARLSDSAKGAVEG